MTIDENKWTAVRHKWGRGGPYTFHSVKDCYIPVSHRGPKASSNLRWSSESLEKCINLLIKDFGEENLEVEQFDTFQDMFRWLSETQCEPVPIPND